MPPLSELNALRCNAEWAQVFDLAMQNSQDPSFALAAIESKVIAAEVSGEDVKPLLNLLPRSLSDPDDAFIEATVRGHIHLLLGAPKKALVAFNETFEIPSGSAYVGANVVKSRALIGTAYSQLGNIQSAVETLKSLNISDRTLQTNKEAAIWATRLFSLLDEMEPSAEVKEKYERVIQLGNLSGEPRVTPLGSHGRHGTANHPAATGAVAGTAIAGAAGAAGLPSSSETPTSETETNGRSTSHSHGASSNAVPAAGTAVHSSQDPDTTGATQNTVAHHSDSKAKSSKHPTKPGHSHSHSVGTTHEATPLQKKLAQQQLIEREADDAVDKWRRVTEFQHPLRLVTSDAARDNTKGLLQKILNYIEQTFDSAALMRMLTEVLVALGEYKEADAAFQTYYTYQKLQLLKAASGAHATPDSELRSAHLLSLALTVICLAPERDDKSRLDRIAEYLIQVNDTMPTKDEEAVGIAHSVLARGYAWQAFTSVGNDYLEDRMSLAEHHFERALQSTWQGDASTLYLKGLLMLQKHSSAEVFVYIKDAVSQFPDFLPLWHFLILLLTAEQQFSEAQTVTEQVLLEYAASDLTKLSPQNKRYLIEIKKTGVAIVEARFGIAAALEELSGTLELVAALYPHNEAVKSQESIAKVQENAHTVHSGKHHTKRHLLRPHRSHRYKFNKQQLPTTGKKQKSMDLETKSHLALIWLWVSQVYIRADLFNEAGAAIKEAENLVGPTAASVAASGHTLTASDPVAAWHKFSSALALDHDNMSAIVGQAVLLDTHGRITDGIVDESKPSVLFHNSEDELQAARASLSSLGNLINHNPGRYTSEAWCLYGVMLDVLGDKTNAREALWKSVELEERSGVRAYIPNLEYT